MDKPLDPDQSIELATRIKSKAKSSFQNASKAVSVVDGALYVQGFVACVGAPYKPIEHGWLELSDRILDPSLPHLNRKPEHIHYYAAQKLTAKQLRKALEEAQEDYPEDDPLPIYGSTPYEYYGDLMLGGKEYTQAYEAAVAKCAELNPRKNQNAQN
ncbi:hypothetical protein Q2T42_17215 [Leptolyngbya boryana CZ1]|uniref:Uncharacterized protein n=1 Tax=Leptolyngbya boryana CZ1 TaxID=3060204 RepID=A0AA97ATU4_LEPBY|nr:hypothetical protein [Leptolyngbya boryana]WNZ43586.1 hypothetical protein Q2T42_17215 [Leptolyngbya boryana CZ1]